jgi:hypothetical protein
MENSNLEKMSKEDDTLLKTKVGMIEKLKRDIAQLEKENIKL